MELQRHQQGNCEEGQPEGIATAPVAPPHRNERQPPLSMDHMGYSINRSNGRSEVPRSKPTGARSQHAAR
jgi:hypothetical protein